MKFETLFLSQCFWLENLHNKKSEKKRRKLYTFILGLILLELSTTSFVKESVLCYIDITLILCQ